MTVAIWMVERCQLPYFLYISPPGTTFELTRETSKGTELKFWNLET